MYNGYRCPPKPYLWPGVKTSTALDLAQWRRTQCALRAPVPHAANSYASNSTRAAEEGDASPSIDVITYKKDRIAGDDLSQETPHDNEDFELTRDPPRKAYLWSGVKTSTASDLAQWRRTQCALRAPVPHAANSYASNSTRAAEEGDASPSIDVITYKKDRIAGDDLSQETPHDNEDFELTRDPPSYDSGTPLSEVDANTMMDKIEVRTKWLQANGKARKLQEADPECSLAIFPECDEGRSVKKCSIEQRDLKRDKKCPRAMTVEHHGRRLHDAKGSDKAYRWKTWCVVNGECWGSNVPVLPLTDVKMVATPNKPFDVDGHRPPRGTPPHKRAALGGGSDVVAERTDSAITPTAFVNSPCPREVGHRPPRDDSGRVREEYEKGTIAGDDLKAFCDKYHFLPYRFLPYGTNLCNMWAAMQREAHKTCPRDYIKLKTAFQQYKDSNTNWKDTLLSYRADKIKEWNQDHGIGPHESVDWTIYKKGTIAGDNPKVFCDKYCFRPHGETETHFRHIWTAMERVANKTHPGDPTKMKATFQQYKDANTNWKDILLAHRNEKIKEWNQDANMFRDKYGFYPHGETETELIRIWTKMERAAHKTCPSSRDHTKLKAAFQQYKDANTNWKDILLAYRADKTKEWNRAADVITVAAGVGENTMAAGVGEDIEQCKLIRQLYEDVVDWQSQRCISSIPCRHSLDEEERRLGCRLQHALIRQYRDPSLANVDTSLINRIRGVGAQEQPRAWIRKLYNDVIEWRSQRSTSSIPRRHFFGDDEERRLAFRLQRARTPSSRAKFTKVDEGFINSISDIISIRSQITFKKARESARKAKESWKTVKENFQLTIESMRKAKATESLQKVSRKRSEIRKAQSLWCVRLKAVKKFQEQNFRLPVRNKRTTKCEQGLANWLDKAKQRKDRALSSRPSERLLTNTEYVQLKELFDRQEVLDRKTLVSITRSQNARKKARESIQKAKRKLGDS